MAADSSLQPRMDVAANDDVLILTSEDGDFQMLGSLATNAARLSILLA